MTLVNTAAAVGYICQTADNSKTKSCFGHILCFITSLYVITYVTSILESGTLTEVFRSVCKYLRNLSSIINDLLKYIGIRSAYVYQDKLRQPSRTELMP